VANARLSPAEDELPLRVFLSYRHVDNPDYVGRFHDRLQDAFGEENVFRDLDSIDGGSNFAETIRRELQTIDVVVALIGPAWVDRLNEPNDFIRMEITWAMEHDRAVVPVLMGTTPLPPSEALPGEMQTLLDLQAIQVRHDPDFRRDVTRAIDGVRAGGAAFRTRRDEARRAAEAAKEEAERRAADEVERLRAAEHAAAEREEAEARHEADELARQLAAQQAEIRRLEADLHERRLTEERALAEQLAVNKAEAEARARQARERRTASESTTPTPRATQPRNPTTRRAPANDASSSPTKARASTKAISEKPKVAPASIPSKPPTGHGQEPPVVPTQPESQLSRVSAPGPHPAVYIMGGLISVLVAAIGPITWIVLVIRDSGHQFAIWTVFLFLGLTIAAGITAASLFSKASIAKARRP
jgi:hypothetical protein